MSTATFHTIAVGDRSVFCREAGPDAEIDFFNTGHFALEAHHTEIAAVIRRFLQRVTTPAQSIAL